MNWQSLSILSCLLFGVGAIFISVAAKIQPGLPTVICYGTGFIGTALLAGILNWKSVTFVKTAVIFGLIAGCCGGLAVVFQVFCLGTWQTKVPWIILIGALYPVVVIAYGLVLGERFTLTQWLGVCLAIVAIVLICMPGKDIQ